MLDAFYHMLMYGTIIVGSGIWRGERLSFMWEFSQAEQLLQFLGNKRLV